MSPGEFLKWCEVFHVQRGGTPPPTLAVNFFAQQAVQQTLSNSTILVNFDTAIYDSGGYFDTSNGRYTPQVPGVYSFNTQIVLTAPDNTSGQARVLLFNPENGGLLVSVTPFVALVAGVVPIMPILTPNLNFNGTTDALSVYVQIVSYTGTPIMIDNATYSTYFQGFLTN